MRVPEQVVLWGLLILLWAHGHTSWSKEEGNLCAFWPDRRKPPIKIFRCPLPNDAVNNKFCCGTCSLPYCCSVRVARATEDWCHHLEPWKDSFVPAPKPTIEPVTAKYFNAEIALLVLSHVLMIVIVLLIIEYCRRCRRRRRRHGNDAPANFPMVVHSDPRPSDSIPPQEVHDPPPPYEERPSLPLSIQEDPANGNHQEDRAAARKRRRVRWLDQVAVQSPMTSEPMSGTAAAEEMTPELGAAAGGENPPEQGAAGGGEGASCAIMSSAPGEISTQPAPVKKKKKKIPGSSRRYPSTEDYPLHRQVGHGEDTPPPSRQQVSEEKIHCLREHLLNTLPTHRDKERATVGPRRSARTVHGWEEAATQARTTSGATSATGEPDTTGGGTPEETTGNMAPESQAATAGHITPVQGAAWNPAVGGEGASRVMSSAPGVITTQPAPLKMTIPSSPSMEDYELRRQVGCGEDTLPPSHWQVTEHTPPSEETIRCLREHLSNTLPAHCGMKRATAGKWRSAGTVHGREKAANQARMTIGPTSATGEPTATRDVTPEPGAAAGGEISPVQATAAGGKATAKGGPAGRGEGASRVMSSAPGVITTQPAPLKLTIPSFSRVSWETKESEV